MSMLWQYHLASIQLSGSSYTRQLFIKRRQYLWRGVAAAAWQWRKAAIHVGGGIAAIQHGHVKAA